MAKLLAKLRINYASLIMIPDVTDMPQEATIRGHTKLLQTYNDTTNHEGVVSPEEALDAQTKTNIHLRLREWLKKYSTESSLIVMSLPMPRDVSFFYWRIDNY